MDLESVTSKREIFMQASGETIKFRETVAICFRIVTCIEVKSKKVSNMVEENIFMKMVTIMKGSGKTIKKMAMGCFITRIRIKNMRAIG